MTYEDLEIVNKELKTTDIKGKQYAEVPQRIQAFRKLYPEGFIRTEIVSLTDGVVVIKAEVGFRDTDGAERVIGTGLAYEKEGSTFINKTSYIENCETSAWGRALGAAGFGIDTSVASYEEVANAIKNQADAIMQAPASKEQIAYIKANCSEEELARAIKKYGTLEDMPESDAQKKIMSINKNKIKEIEQ